MLPEGFSYVIPISVSYSITIHVGYSWGHRDEQSAVKSGIGCGSRIVKLSGDILIIP